MKYLFEVSWEVCNLVGGIHTVLRSKASEAVTDFNDNYFLIGPMLDNNINFVETDDEIYKQIRPALEKKGLSCKLGRWDIDGNPRAILVNFSNRYDSGKLLYQYWQKFGVNSINASWDYIEPVFFSTACGEVIETIHDVLLSEKDSAVAQFHEWMSGGGLLHIKKTSPEIGTIFTTHATILGRSMSGSGVDIYSDETVINPEEDAKRFGVQAKASMETICAREADIFTTVSNVTADESVKTLKKRPHYCVFNGINTQEMGKFSDIRKKAKTIRPKTLSLASAFLGTKLPEDTRLWMTSGRYEYHNKGYDLFLETLARLNNRLQNQENSPTVVAWFLIATGNEGIKQDFVDRINSDNPQVDDPGVITHHLQNEYQDAIVSNCHRLGLNNSDACKVKVIFSPEYINDNDQFFNMNYYDALSSFDLGVFPSNYEPWGYTPMESIAMAVPTITSDLAGFGRWAQELSVNIKNAIKVIPRANKSYESACDALYKELKEFVDIAPNDMESIRKRSRKIADMASWSNFYQNYQKSYNAATVITEKRLNSLDTSSFSDELFISFKGTQGSGPHYRRLTVSPTLPKEFSKLSKLANNLWWTWHKEASELFSELDPELWKTVETNPILLLEKLPQGALQKKTEDPLFINKYNKVIHEFESYMSAKGRTYKNSKEISKQTPVAYFSMEYGIHQCLPIYSGGLGILSGDHMKSASDLNLPLVGVGYLYKDGYFQQEIGVDGMQIEHYPKYDPGNLPVEMVTDKQGQQITVSVPLPGREVTAKIWKANVGRITLYLLDTDIDTNLPEDRTISARLYGGGKKTRIEQEIILGMGGVKLLEDKLDLKPSVYHLNEGHCGFLLFERIERYMSNHGFTYQKAREMVKATSVFTTHTPVPAGNETFDMNLMQEHFKDFAPKISVPFEELIELGRSTSDGENSSFSMTVFALKLTSRANGVSKLHGEVCKDMWQGVWNHLDRNEVPITSVTNGIHITSWIGEDIKRMLSQYLDIDWDNNQDNKIVWMGVDQIPDETIWQAHKSQKKKMLDNLKNKLFEDYSRRGESPTFIKESIESLNPDALTIGFARRFATYKRATLLFKHRDALIKLLNDPKQPVQLIFAGKAHPADIQGKELIQKIIVESRTPEFQGKIIYIENYNIQVAKWLTQGVDVWLNTPVRPHEASGTSGMKVVPNGGLNFSILDGWWDEGYDEEVGFAIKSSAQPLNRDHQDELDNNSLFTVLINKIIPLYYDQTSNNISVKWVKMMKDGFKKLAPEFSTMRMVDEYHSRLYLPTAIRGNELSKDNFKGIEDLTNWKRSIKARFSTVQIEQIIIKGLDGDMLPANTPLEIEMTVIPGRLKADEIQAELIIGQEAGNNFASQPDTIALKRVEGDDPTVFTYTLSLKLNYGGILRYAVRVVPTHPMLTSTQETGIVHWA